jgi:hypothetical protein
MIGRALALPVRVVAATALVLVAMSISRTDDHLRATATQSSGPNHDPDAATLITSDVPNFCRVFDKASLTTAADLFQREYIDAGSPGLKDFFANRIVNGRYLAATVAARPRYYAAIRRNSLALEGSPEIKESIRAGFHRLKALCPGVSYGRSSVRTCMAPT